MGYGLLHGPLEAKPLLASTCGRLSEIALVIAAVITGVLRLIRTDVTWAADRIGCFVNRTRRSAIATRPTSVDVEFRRPLVEGAGCIDVIRASTGAKGRAAVTNTVHIWSARVVWREASAHHVGSTAPLNLVSTNSLISGV